MPEMKGIELLEKIMQTNTQTAVIIIPAYGSLETAIGALRSGASDYILKPIEFDELIVKIPVARTQQDRAGKSVPSP